MTFSNFNFLHTILLGHSPGGTLSLWLAAQNPGMISKPAHFIMFDQPEWFIEKILQNLPSQ